MCFYIKEGSGVKVANQDIVCYKKLNPVWFGLLGYKSPIFGFFYRKGVTYVSKLSIFYDSIEKGLHSYKDLDFAKITVFCYKESDRKYLKFYKFIIPKGAEYYENDTEYCSNQIKMVGRVR